MLALKEGNFDGIDRNVEGELLDSWQFYFKSLRSME
jgi:hypothetical protein